MNKKSPFHLSLFPPIPRPANCAPENSIPPPIHTYTHTHTQKTPPGIKHLTHKDLPRNPTHRANHPPPPSKKNQQTWTGLFFSFLYGGRSFPEKRSEPLAKVEILKKPTYTQMCYTHTHTRTRTHTQTDRRTRGVRDNPGSLSFSLPPPISLVSPLSQGTNSVWSEMLPPLGPPSPGELTHTHCLLFLLSLGV